MGGFGLDDVEPKVNFDLERIHSTFGKYFKIKLECIIIYCNTEQRYVKIR